MSNNVLPQRQLGLFPEAFPETNQVVVPIEIKPEVLEILALLLADFVSQERHPIAVEANHAR